MTTQIVDPPFVPVGKHIIFCGEVYTLYDGRWKNVRTRERLSRAVWQAYYGPIPRGREIHHWNEDKADDRPSNLRCWTKAEHSAHHGRQQNHLAHYVATVETRVTCPQCGKVETRRSGHARFCSKLCKSAWHRAQPGYNESMKQIKRERRADPATREHDNDVKRAWRKAGGKT